MDIAKYIGLFLLKNEYCFLPGIGSLNITRKPAKYDKESGKLLPPEYTVDYERNSGSIDDSFANFIANNERISIVHASNYLKDFCSEMKTRLKNGEEVNIPAIGTFKEDSDQIIIFEKDPHLNVKGKSIPIFKNSASVEQKQDDLLKIIENTEIKEPKGDEEIVIKPPTVNWTKIIIIAVVAIGIIAVIIYFVTNLVNTKNLDKSDNQTEIVQPADTAVTRKTSDTAATTTLPANNKSDSFMVAINQYPDLAAATKRSKQLNSFGNKTAIWTKDSSAFYVIFKIDTVVNQQKAIDSLRRIFNPNGTVETVGQP